MSRHWGKQGLASHGNLMGQVLDLLAEVSLESLVRRREKRKLLSVKSQEEQKRMDGSLGPVQSSALYDLSTWRNYTHVKMGGGYRGQMIYSQAVLCQGILQKESPVVQRLCPSASTPCHPCISRIPFLKPEFHGHSVAAPCLPII